MKYVCHNPECSAVGVEEEFFTETYQFIDGALRGKNAPCPVCGHIREEVNENEEISPEEKNVSLAKFAMASPEAKREILKKRSHDHYEKEIRPMKEEKLRKAVENFKEASRK